MGAVGSVGPMAVCTTHGEELEAVAVSRNKVWAMKLEMAASVGGKRGQKSGLCIRGWNRRHAEGEWGERLGLEMSRSYGRNQRRHRPDDLSVGSYCGPHKPIYYQLYNHILLFPAVSIST